MSVICGRRLLVVTWLTGDMEAREGGVGEVRGERRVEGEGGGREEGGRREGCSGR